jgi:general stress protein 26
MNKNATDIQKLWDLIRGIEIAMLTTVDSTGVLHSRPMATQDIDFDGHLWFFTEAASHKVDEVNGHREVNLVYVDKEKNRYVSVSGRARVIRDVEKARLLWRPHLRAWFPKGVEDPSVALLRVEVSKADYWDAPSSKVVELMHFLSAMAASPSSKGTEHGKFTLSKG